jgi:hypothetical protein
MAMRRLKAPMSRLFDIAARDNVGNGQKLAAVLDDRPVLGLHAIEQQARQQQASQQ